MIMPVARPLPPEHNRRWVSLLGQVTSHQLLDRRNFLSRWLGQKVPVLRCLLSGVNHMLVIELSPEARELAG